MKMVSISRIVAMGMLLVCGLPRTDAQSAVDADAGSKVLALERLWGQAAQLRDIKALDSIFDEGFVNLDIDGRLMTKTQTLADTLSTGPVEIVVISTGARVHGSVVIVTGVLRLKGLDHGKPYLRHGRFVDTWLYKNAHWVCIGGETTLIRDHADYGAAMMRWSRLRGKTIIAIVTAVCAAGWCSVVQGADSESDAASKVRALEHKRAEAEVRKDNYALDAMFDGALVLVEADGTLLSKSDYLARMRGETQAVLDVAVESMTVRVFGATTVIVDLTYRERGMRDGREFVQRRRSIDTWVNKAGKWVCIASASRLAQ